MCLAYCYVRALLYDTDTEELCGVCPYNFPEGRTCRDCRHASSVCALTRAPLPARGWCCHADFSPAPPAVEVTAGGGLWGVWARWGLERVLALYGVEAMWISEGRCRIELDQLSRPLTYGVPVSHWEMAEDSFPERDEERVPSGADEAFFLLL